MNAVTATSQRELTDRLRTLVKTGEIRCGVPYTRAQLIAVLGPSPEAAKAWFTLLRGCLGSVLPGIDISTRGGGRGIRYVFEAIEDLPPGAVTILAGDNLRHLSQLPAASFRLIYIDPPFNTGRRQSRTHMTTVRDDTTGDRTGYKGQRYRTIVHGTKAYIDTFADYLGFLAPRLEQAHRLLSSDGSLFLHLDYREVHYAKVLLDDIFGRDCFINELIWAYDYGARTKRKWSAKHDNILWYAKNPKNYVFNYEAMDRIPYMAPGLVGPKKAARGKTPTDVWWHTIVSPNGHEKTGYPTQKPLGIVRRIVKVHSSPGDALLDFFAGSGTLGQAGAELGRCVTLVDQNPEALSVMRRRLASWIQPSGASEAAEVAEDAEVSKAAEALKPSESKVADASESLNPLESLKPSESLEASESASSSKAAELLEASPSNSLDSSKASATLEASESVSSSKAAELLEASESESASSSKAAELLDSSKASETLGTSESMDSSKASETLGTSESMDSSKASESSGPSGTSGPETQLPHIAEHADIGESMALASDAPPPSVPSPAQSPGPESRLAHDTTPSPDRDILAQLQSRTAVEPSS